MVKSEIFPNLDEYFIGQASGSVQAAVVAGPAYPKHASIFADFLLQKAYLRINQVEDSG